MANWAITNYVIEGPKEVLHRIYNAILHHDVEGQSDENWEGNTLVALGIEWDRRNPTGKYMRGFIDKHSVDLRKDVLMFEAEEAWGATDFNEVLEENLPVKVYYNVEEPDCGLYATNDKEGKYFRDRWFVDTCIDGDYNAEYFTEEKYVYEWLSDITNGRIKCGKDVNEFNESQDKDEDDFISIYEFKIIDTNKETQE